MDGRNRTNGKDGTDGQSGKPFGTSNDQQRTSNRAARRRSTGDIKDEATFVPPGRTPRLYGRRDVRRYASRQSRTVRASFSGS